MTTELVQHEEVALLDVLTGEVLPATLDNAATVLIAAREMKSRIQDVIRNTELFLAEQSRTQGTKTFHVDGADISLTGGASTSYDPVVLMEALRLAECPEERIEEAVVAEVSYKVNRSVLRQLTGANPDYAAAADLAKVEEEKPVRATVKPKGTA